MTAPTYQLTKHHGLGNDFLIAVLDGDQAAARPPDGDDARRWCDRRLGVGADGLIVAVPVDVGPADPAPRTWRMVLWNADGGRAEISGNGLRCLGQALVRRLDVDAEVEQTFTIETDAGARSLLIRPSGRADELLVRVGMGKAVDGPPPSDRWAALGVEVETQVGVDIGNPHLVAIVGSIEGIDIGTVGPAIEADYPGGLNVHLAEVIDRGHLDLLVWERGAGATQACGSGACAAAWVANRAGLADTEVTVTMPGGTAEVAVGGDEILLTGPAVFVAEVAMAAGGRA